MKKIILKIEGMTCSACSNSLEHFLKKQPHIIDASVNLVMASATITYDDELNIKDLETIVNKSGFTSRGEYKINDDKKNTKSFVWLMIFLALTILFMYFTMGHMLKIPQIPFFDKHHNPINYGILCLVLTIPFLIYGFDIIKMGIKNIFYKSANMDTLVTLGVASSFIYSIVNLLLIIIGKKNDIEHLYFESVAMVIFFVKLGRFLDQSIKNKTKNAIEELVQITPENAKRKNNEGFETITIDLVSKGDILVSSAGDKISVDGTVTSGECYVDEAFITGESKPVKKQIGDNVIAGSILYNGYIEYEAKKIGKESTISEIVKMVIDATNTKPKISKIADKVSGIFVPSIIGIAIIVFILYLIISKDFNLSINTFVTILVVACPCALGLATPLAVVTSIGTLAKINILIKNGEVFEIANKIDTIIFDKTGTLTHGKLNVSKKITYINDLENYVSILEAKSNHPIATAFTSSINKDVHDFEVLPGMGIKGTIDNNTIYVGNRKLVEELGVANNHLDEESELAKNGNSIVYVIMDNEIQQLYGIKDTIKENSFELINRLKDLNIKTIMLSGDNKETAQIVAKSLGIDEVIAEALPSAKQKFINELLDNNHYVMMVGDGINDAPSLAKASIGVSIKSATNVAVDSSDVIIMNNDLLKIIDFLKVSKKTILNIKENLFWAFFYNLLMIPIAAGALISLGITFNPMIASIGMTLSSLCVLLNALRLTIYRKKKER